MIELKENCNKLVTQTRFYIDGTWNEWRFLDLEKLTVLRNVGYSDSYLCELEDRFDYSTLDEMIKLALMPVDFDYYGDYCSCLDDDNNLMEVF